MTDVQVFTTDDYWVRPSGVKHVQVVAVAGGGGGGGGDVGGAGVNGGGGGQGGGYVTAEFAAYDLQEQVGVQVGTGGPGGGSTADGTAGEDSVFGAILTNEVLGVTSSIQNTDATSLTVNLPDGSNVVGRLLIVCVVKDGSGAITWPAGWTEWTSDNVFAANSAIMGFRSKIVDGSEGFSGTGDSITVTGASEKWQSDAWLIERADETAQPSTNEGLASAAVAPAGIAFGPATKRYLHIIQAAWNDDPGAVTGFPSGFTDNQNQAATSSPGHTRLARCSKYSSDPFSPTTGTFTVPNGDWATATIVVSLTTQTEVLRAKGGGGGASASGLGGSVAFASTVGWTTAIDGGAGGKGGGDYGGGYVAAIGGTGTVFSGAGGGGGGGRDGGGTGQTFGQGGQSPAYGIVGGSINSDGDDGSSTGGGAGGRGGAGQVTTGSAGRAGGAVGGGGGGGGGAGTTGGTGGTGGDGRVWVYSW